MRINEPRFLQNAIKTRNVMETAWKPANTWEERIFIQTSDRRMSSSEAEALIGSQYFIFRKTAQTLKRSVLFLIK